jgi:hypothetical protein
MGWQEGVYLGGGEEGEDGLMEQQRKGSVGRKGRGWDIYI